MIAAVFFGRSSSTIPAKRGLKYRKCYPILAFPCLMDLTGSRCLPVELPKRIAKAVYSRRIQTEKECSLSLVLTKLSGRPNLYAQNRNNCVVALPAGILTDSSDI